MKKRIVAAILAAAMALALVACGGPQPLTEEDLSFIFVETGNTAIAIGMTAEQIEKNFGVTMEGLRNWTGDSVFVAFEGSSLTPESPQSVFTHAQLRGASDKLTTPRGIKVGDTMDKVIATYGEPDLIDATILYYVREGLPGGLLFDMSGEKTVDEIIIDTAASSYVDKLNEKGDR